MKQCPTFPVLLISFLLSLAACNLDKVDEGENNPQNQLEKFSRIISETDKKFYGASAIETADGGYLVAGSISPTNVIGGDQVHLVKLTKSGLITYQKTLGNGYANKVIPSFDGGFIIVGSQGAAAGSTNAVIMKTNASGDLLDTKLYNNSGLGFCQLNDVVATSDGNYIAVGGLESQPWIIKFDQFLATKWTKTVTGFYAGFLHGLSATPDANFAATGLAEIASGEAYRVLLYKINLSGVELHKSTFGAGAEYDEGADLVSLEDGYVLTGYSESNSTVGKAISLAKFNTGFVSQWGNYDNETAGYSSGSRLLQDSTGNFVVAGTHSGKLFLWKTNSSGVTQWFKDFNLASQGADVIETSDGGLLTVGTFSTGFSNGNLVVLKTDKNGNLQ